MWGNWTASIKTKNGVAFSTGSFLITNSLNMDVSYKKRLCSTLDIFSVFRVVLFNTYKNRNIFTFSRKVLKFWNYNIWSFSMSSHCQWRIQNLMKHPGAFCRKPLGLFTKRFIVDIWVRIVTIDCNMYYCEKVTWKVY